MAFDVFLSHSTKDKEVVENILVALERDGISCWIAPRNITLGQDWTECIESAIKQARLLLLILSPHSNQSPEIKRELQLAADRRIIIAPVALGDTKPAEGLGYTLARAHRISIATSPTESDVRRVVEAIKAALGPTPPPPPPLVARRSRWMAIVASVVFLLAIGVWMWTRPNAGQTTTRPSPPAAASPPIALPSRLASLPAAPLLKLVYESAPVATAGATLPAMSVGILARRQGKEFAVLNDGEPLASEVDDYLLGTNTPSGGYLYVFQVDSRGKVDQLFPKRAGAPYSSGDNPLAAGSIVQAPAKNSERALTLDRNPGVEHVYFVLSVVRWPELERLLEELQVAPSPPGPAIANVIEPNAIGLRGVGGLSDIKDAPEVEMTLFNNQQKIPGNGRLLRASGSVLVIERWFRHQP